MSRIANPATWRSNDGFHGADCCREWICVREPRSNIEGKRKRYSMHRTNGRVLVSLLALSLSGCVSNKPIRYYTIKAPAAPALTTSAHAVSLLVASVSGPEIFRDTPIAYRVGANEIGTYQYRRWA